MGDSKKPSRRLLAALSLLSLPASAPLAQSLPVLKTTLPASWDESWFGSPAVYDLDGDGKPEVVFTTYSVDHFVPHLTILDRNGCMQRMVVLDKRGAMGAPTMADADGDGNLDILVSLKDVVGSGSGGVQILTVAGSGAKAPLWPTGRGATCAPGSRPRPKRPSPSSVPRRAPASRPPAAWPGSTCSAPARTAHARARARISDSRLEL